MNNGLAILSIAGCGCFGGLNDHGHHAELSRTASSNIALDLNVLCPLSADGEQKTEVITRRQEGTHTHRENKRVVLVSTSDGDR